MTFLPKLLNNFFRPLMVETLGGIQTQINIPVKDRNSDCKLQVFGSDWL